MADSLFKYIDYSGEKGKMRINGVLVAPSTFETAVVPLSYCGFTERVALEQTALTVKLAPDGDETIFEADKDVKCILIFKDTADNNSIVRIAIPAPKVNVASGIVKRKTGDRAMVPMLKNTGEVGNDGTELAAIFSTMLGTTLVFSSGSFTKPAS